MLKKVILTGATGLIGKEAVEPLKKMGFEVICLTSKNCNLFNYNNVDTFFKKHKAQYLLHFAWFTGEGYLESNLNPKYVQASLNMLKSFKENGGKRAVYAGTCFEYKFKDTALKEDDELNPTTLYAKSKVELFNKATKYSKQNNISFGWGRIFYVYGKNEALNRLTPYIINSLKENKQVEIKCGHLIKDYMYTKDIAEAFVKFLDSKVEGAVNICTNKGITLEDYAKIIAKELDRENLLTIKYEQTMQPPSIVGDNTILTKNIGYKAQYSVQDGLKDII